MEQLNYPEQYNKLITGFLENPDQLYRVDADTLQQLLEKYPFSQPLHFISAARKKEDAAAFESYLPKASAYAPRRDVLYGIIHKPETFKYVAESATLNKQLDSVTNLVAEVPELTGNAIEPPAHFEDVVFEPEDVSTEVEDNRNAGLPEDASSDDSIFEHVVAEAQGHLDTATADEDEPVEEIAEATSPYETEAVDLVSSEHNAFIEADETELLEAEPEPEEEIADVSREEPVSNVQAGTADHEDEIVPESIAEKIPEPEEKNTEEALQQDKLIGSIAGSDFFAFERSAVDPLQADEPKKPAPAKREAEGRKVSKYNDDKLPYTFLWWLNKTRKEHADTYQPYADFSLDTSQAIRQTAPVEELNHQIIENIFHLQTPLGDIAAEAPANTVHFELKRKEDDIIEKFIKEEPQIKPPQPEKIDTENKARRSAEDPNDLVSETLARIYTDQMLYHKAIDTYKKLSLKFPEKSTYFADQIVQLEKKSIN